MMALLGHALLLSKLGAGSPWQGMVRHMRLSTIRKHRLAGGGSDFASALGSEIRRRRLALGLSQARIGGPFSRAFMSRVEQGRLTPSLPSLIIIARRLNSSGSEILATVEAELDAEQSDDDEGEAAFSC